MACKDKNHLPLGVNWRRVVEYVGGSWRTEGAQPVPVGVFTYHVSLSCMHCQTPACLPACPVEAIRKRPDGIVLADPGRCLGCHYCEWACPYGPPQFGQHGDTMTECDLCADLLDQGGAPARGRIPHPRPGLGPLEQLRAEHGTLQAIEPQPGP